MKLSEIKGKKGLELLGEIIDPVTRIFHDGRVFNNLFGGSVIHAVKWIAKEHLEDGIALWCAFNNKKKCDVDALTMASDLVDILTDDDLMAFFKLQSRSILKSSGSATENTGETEGE